MKTKEELNALKEEVKALNRKLSELNEEELEQVIGGHGSLPHMEPDERYIMTLGASPNGGVDFRQDFDTKQDVGQYEFHIYSDDPDRDRFNQPKWNG